MFHKRVIRAKAAHVADVNEEKGGVVRAPYIRSSTDVASDLGRFLVSVLDGDSKAERFVAVVFELKVKEVCLSVMCMWLNVQSERVCL